jgi:hypothetical protein
MTVLSVLTPRGEGSPFRHPLDLSHCIRDALLSPKGKKVPRRMHAVRHCKASVNASSDCRGDAVAFLFCAQELQDSRLKASESMVPSHDEKDDVEVAGVRLPPFEYANLSLLLPAAVASHSGLLLGAGAACACLPIMAPFSIPQVSPDSWMANKRALAFHRSCVFGVYAQGALALMKFAGGDLVGGTYLGIQAAMGCYSVTPDGTRFMPTYMVISGFNGLLGIIQVFQSYQGVPLHFIPLWVYLPPALSILTCYWGWEYCREMRAIGAGLPGDGPQDTCWVKFMGGDIWPISALSPSPESSADRDQDQVRGLDTPSRGGLSQRFSAFGGSGHRLGET